MKKLVSPIPITSGSNKRRRARESMAVFKYYKLHLKEKGLSKWPNFGSGLHTNKNSWKLLTCGKIFKFPQLCSYFGT